MVNDFEVIHMGGRTYNPILGRFMQADPFVQAPTNLQNYNRYSYVLNNPMSYTDPSGYFFKKLVKGVMDLTGSNKVLKELSRNKYLNMAVQAGVCFYGGPVACGAYAGAQTFAVTGSLRAGVKSGVITGVSAWAFSKIGEYYGEQTGSGNINFGGNQLSAAHVAGQITAHAMVGGVTASLQGGKFGHGFFSAGVTKGLGGRFLPGGPELTGSEVVYGTVVSAMIGGTASVVAGGKFENGAKTAVFQYLYNQAQLNVEEKMFNAQLEATLKDVLKVSLDLDKGLSAQIIAGKNGFKVALDTNGNWTLSRDNLSITVASDLLEGSIAKSFARASLHVGASNSGVLTVGGSFKPIMGAGLTANFQMRPDLYLRATIIGQRYFDYGSMGAHQRRECAAGLKSC